MARATPPLAGAVHHLLLAQHSWLLVTDRRLHHHRQLLVAMTKHMGTVAVKSRSRRRRIVWVSKSQRKRILELAIPVPQPLTSPRQNNPAAAASAPRVVSGQSRTARRMRRMPGRNWWSRLMGNWNKTKCKRRALLPVMARVRMTSRSRGSSRGRGRSRQILPAWALRLMKLQGQPSHNRQMHHHRAKHLHPKFLTGRHRPRPLRRPHPPPLQPLQPLRPPPSPTWSSRRECGPRSGTRQRPRSRPLARRPPADPTREPLRLAQTPGPAARLPRRPPSRSPSARLQGRRPAPSPWRGRRTR